MAFEVRVDCPACRAEGARVETWASEAPSDRLGVPSAARCRLCGHDTEGRVTPATTAAAGEGCPGCGSALDEASLAAHRCPFCGASAAVVETAPARVPVTLEELERALGAWAAEESLASADELVEGCFVLTTPAAILAALAREEVVETTFDVVDYLFSAGHGQGGSPSSSPAPASGPSPPRAPASGPPPPPSAPVPRWGSAPEQQASATGVPRDAPAAPSAPGWTAAAPASVRRVGGPRDELLALASVAASDGEASAEDLEVLARAAAVRDIPPLAPEEIRVRRPGEIDPPATLVRREQLLFEMFHMAWSDEQLDESEIRVVREFARAWGVDPQRVAEWTAAVTTEGKSRIARWIDRVGYFLFPGW